MRSFGVAAALASCAPLAADAPVAERYFLHLTELAGDWEGTFEWSQGRTGSGPMRVAYRMTGAGSAVVEDLIVGSTSVMSSVYHLDGDSVRMTHYCAAQNQPRLRAVRIDDAARKAEFELVDVTNAQHHPAHVEAFAMEIVDDGHLELRFTFGGAPGQAGVETVRLVRRPAPAES